MLLLLLILLGSGLLVSHYIFLLLVFYLVCGLIENQLSNFRFSNGGCCEDLGFCEDFGVEVKKFQIFFGWVEGRSKTVEKKKI